MCHLHIHSFHHLSILPLFKVTLNGYSFTAGLDDMKKMKGMILLYVFDALISPRWQLKGI